MAKRNYLIEGVSGAGKSSVCMELRRLGYQAIDGDNELAYQGDPETGAPVSSVGAGVPAHETHIWDVNKVKQIINNKNTEVAFFCGGSRNFSKFIDLFDGVFILEHLKIAHCRLAFFVNQYLF